MNTTHARRAGATVLLIVVGVLAGRALATGVPTASPLTFSGLVTDDAGKPYAAAVPVIVKLYAGQNANTAACTAATTEAEAGTGRFEAVLAADCAKAVHDSNDLWSELTVGANKIVLPRSRVGAVPYALEAQVASGAGGALAAEMAATAKSVTALQDGLNAVEKRTPTLVDANNNVIGTVLDAGGNQYAAITKAGAVVHLDLATGALALPPNKQIFYFSSDCSGTPYSIWPGHFGMIVQPYQAPDPLKFVYYASVKTTAVALVLNSAYLYSSNSCLNTFSWTVAANKSYAELKIVGSAEVGLAAPIKGPVHLEFK